MDKWNANLGIVVNILCFSAQHMAFPKALVDSLSRPVLTNFLHVLRFCCVIDYLKLRVWTF